jgi:CDGSH-type Zn-finger protein/uncharacterized Fe-S cluster protein YjdI
VASADVPTPSREQLIFQLCEAAELEHNLMCTYLYAAFSLRSGASEGLSADEAACVERWRRTILRVAMEEMGHLAAVWNITAALGGSPRFGRANFPLDPGMLPAGIVVKLAPFGAASLQHFVHLERPSGSDEPEGSGFEPELLFTRGMNQPRLTPMAFDYETVGAFYATVGRDLTAFVAAHGEAGAFCGDPALQLSEEDVPLPGIQPVICSKTALAALSSIIEQGEGAPAHSDTSHFRRFAEMRSELSELTLKNPAFSPSFPAAHNPVLRRPLQAQGRVWIEDELASRTVDLANSCYALSLRLLGYAYVLPRPAPEKSLSLDLSFGLMRAMTLLGERAARLPAGPSHPQCTAGMSFTALRDAAPIPTGASAARFFQERLQELSAAAKSLNGDDERSERAARLLVDLAERAAVSSGHSARAAAAPRTAAAPRAAGPEPNSAAAAHESSASAQNEDGAAAPVPTVVDGVEHIPGKHLTLLYETKRCIHARFCVTGAPQVFLANVKGPWIRPDAVAAERLVEIAHACPSGAIRYERRDGQPDEMPPPVNLISIREAGPYAARGELRLAGKTGEYRATLCRCGASKNKPYCDGSHHEINFAASGEPASGSTDMLPVRDGPLDIEPLTDGPLHVRGNLEITSGTGRVVARVTQARLCRCGGSATKPFCDGTHARIGFRSV